jgi:hypothetical protein
MRRFAVRTSAGWYSVNRVGAPDWVMVSEKRPGSFSNLKSGDVLVSHPTAVLEYEISIVPDPPHATASTHDAAVSDGCTVAEALGVDAWLTEDQTHVMKIASHRTRRKQVRGATHR